MDMNQYLDIFVEESREHLQSLNASLLGLEKNNRDKAVLNEIFRVAHTIKGMSGTMGFVKMQRLTHDMEDVLDDFRKERMTADSNSVDVLFKCLDALEGYVNEIVATGNEGAETYDDVIAALGRIQKGEVPEAVHTTAAVPATPVVQESSAPSHPEETQAAPLSESDGTLRVSLDQYERSIIRKALDSGMNVFQIHVEVDKGCLLKAARAFIVFQILERNSEIIKSVPKVEDIEDERFDNEFTVVVISKKTKEFFIKEINSVAEIKDVNVLGIGTSLIEDAEGTLEAAENEAAVTVLDVQAKVSKTGGTTLSSAPVSRTSASEGETTAKKAQKTGKTVRVDIDRLDTLMNLVSELIIIKTRLDESSHSKDSGADTESIEYLERITTSLHDAVMKVRMVPVETVFNRFPRMIRDIARELDKDIELEMSGEETELDRTVIDEIGDPLIHILRNSADHGLENKAEREKAGKGAAGHIYLRAYQDGNNVIIEVEDDGRGINIPLVRRKIVEKGLESPETANALSEKEIIEYLFKPSFSTADKVTDLSGRGVGLDVVKTKIEALGGMVEVDSRTGSGSKFIIRLPLTLAIIQALMVKVGAEKYAIPLSSIQEITNIKVHDVKRVRNQEVMLLRNNVIPIVRLDEILNVEGAVPDSEKKHLTSVIVKKGDKLSAFIVDSLIGQQEIVIKSLGKVMSGVKCIAGATILGDGNVALIVDVNTLAL